MTESTTNARVKEGLVLAAKHRGQEAGNNGRDTVRDAFGNLWDLGPSSHPEPEPAVLPAPISWIPTDLGPYLRGEIVRATPTVGISRSDGLQLLYPGKEHTVIGEMEAGKSWLALACVAAVLLAGQYVVYIHFEEADPGDTIERLLALGLPARLIETRLRFVGPEQPANSFAIAGLLDPVPALVVLDGVNEGMSLHSADIRDEGGVAAFRRRIVKPFTAAGSAVLSCDHVVKDTEKRGRGPLGSVHKGNALTGTLIVLENAEPFGRGQRGRSHVYITKDRPGHLRRHGNATKTPGKTFLGELIVDDSQTTSPDLELRFFAPRTDPSPQDTPVFSPDDVVMDTIRRIDTDGQVATVRAVEASSGLRKAATGDAIERLLLAGRIRETSGPRRSRIFTPNPKDDCPRD